MECNISKTDVPFLWEPSSLVTVAVVVEQQHDSRSCGDVLLVHSGEESIQSGRLVVGHS